MKSVMIDIETLGVKPGCPVLAIGLAAFNMDTVLETLTLSIKPAHWHGEINPQTVAWWLSDKSISQQARDTVTGGTWSDVEAAMQIKGFLRQFGGNELWANDPSFDCTILRAWWDRLPIPQGPFPSHYREERSCRTLFGEAKRYLIDLSSCYYGAIAHDPGSDSACQARAVIMARQALYPQNRVAHAV